LDFKLQLLFEKIINQTEDEFLTDDFPACETPKLSKMAWKCMFDFDTKSGVPSQKFKDYYHPYLAKIPIKQLTTIQVDDDNNFRLTKKKWKKIAPFASKPILVVGAPRFKEYCLVDGNTRATFNKHQGKKFIEAWVVDPDEV